LTQNVLRPNDLAPAASQPGIIDAAIWVGYAWADEPRNHAVVMVTGDDKEKVTRTAEKLAKENNRPVFLFTHDGRINIGRC
jgi:microcystin degradation protein MlrC